MTDYYRDRVRQGGILANKFVYFVRSSSLRLLSRTDEH